MTRQLSDLAWSRAVLGLCLMHGTTQAQQLINDTLTGPSSSYNWKALKGACLTAGNNTGSIPACSGLPYYDGKQLVGGANGRLPDPVGRGALRLTNGDFAAGGNNGDNQTGAVVSDFRFPTNEGLQVTFTTVTYGGDGLNGTGADGISFYLMDGDKQPSVGGLGGSLGYSCSNVNSQYDGVAGGYIGIGIDEYGNFSNPRRQHQHGTRVCRGPHQRARRRRHQLGLAQCPLPDVLPFRTGRQGQGSQGHLQERRGDGLQRRRARADDVDPPQLWVHHPP